MPSRTRGASPRTPRPRTPAGANPRPPDGTSPGTPDAPGRAGPGPLRDARFRRLLFGQAVSGFGDTALYLSLAIWAKDLTGSNAAAGLVFLALTLPVLAGPFAGSLVDRVRRRPLLIATNAAGGVLVIALFAVHDRHQLWIIYAVAAGYGVAATVLGAGRSALLKDLLPDHQLIAANGLIQTLGQGSRLLSPLVGAGIYASAGGGVLAAFDAATFAVAVVALLSIRVRESRPRAAGPALREFVAGFRHLRRVPVLARITLAGALAFGVLGLYETASFAVIGQGLHRPAAFFGVLTSVQGIGALAGGVVSGRLGRALGEARLVGLSLAAFAAGSAALTVPSLPAVLAGVVVAGMALPWFAVGMATAVQRFTPARLVGRVTAAGDLLVLTPQTVSIAAGAALIAVLDYRVLLAVIAVVTAGTAVGLLHGPAAAGPDRPDLARIRPAGEKCRPAGSTAQ